MNKICGMCKVEKDASEFSKKTASEDGLRSECKDCVREYNKKYYQENKENIAGQKKKYYQENKENIAKWNYDYRENNKEILREKSRKYRENNKEKINRVKRVYYQRNKEKIAEKKKEYRQNNKERIAEYYREYRKENPYQIQSTSLSDSARKRAKKNNIPIDLDFISQPNLLDWLKRQPNCVCCNRVFRIGVKGKPGFQNDSPSLDRFNPNLGYVPGNVSLICWRCNHLKNDGTVKELKIIVAWMENKENQMVCKP